MYSEQHLNISGKRSVSFMGEEIVFVSNRETSDATWNEWDAVKVYRIDPDWASDQEKKNGKPIDPYTVGIARCTKWKGSRDRYKVIDAKTIEQVLEIVMRQVPIFHREVEEQLKVNKTPLEARDYEPSRSSVES